MSAGASPKGGSLPRNMPTSISSISMPTIDGVKKRVDASRKTAWDECNREIQVWTNAYIFQADTEAEARAFYDETVFKKGDWAGVENLVSVMGFNSQSLRRRYCSI